jgi:hypothetical protein
MGTECANQKGEALPVFRGNGIAKENQIEIPGPEAIDRFSYRPCQGDDVSRGFPD